MNNKLTAALLTGIVTFSSGCATIVSDDSYPVNLASTPNGAHFTIKDRNGVEVMSGTTPASLYLESSAGYFKKQTYQVVFEQKGYAPKTVTLNSSLDGWYIGNVVFGGLIGLLVIDPLTGAMWKLPNHLSTTLDHQPEADHLQVMTLDQVPEDMRSQMIALNQ